MTLVSPPVSVIRSPAVRVGPNVSRLAVTFPTVSGRMRVSLVLVADGVEHRCIGQSSGRAPYQLVLHPTHRLGAFGRAYMRNIPPEIGISKEGKTYRYWNDVPTEWATARAQQVEAFLEVEGALDVDLPSLEIEHGEAPRVFTKNSVAFDAATDVFEASGDGIVSLTHTSTGTDRAVFAGVLWRTLGTGNGAGTVTYNAVSMGTAKWDLAVPNMTQGMQAGFAMANQATGAVTVTSDVVATGPQRHFLGVISLTGVDQTTPVGTPATANGTATPATVTVGSVGADDMLVDSMVTNVSTGASVGADQTLRNTDVTQDKCYQSSQPGTAGGVMSWTLTGALDFWGIGAIAFKPVAASGLAIPIVMHHRKMMES